MPILKKIGRHLPGRHWRTIGSNRWDCDTVSFEKTKGENMLTNEPARGEQTPVVNPGNYSPVSVTVSDSVGAVFLGIVAVILLIGWRRAETRYRKMLAQ
jgi:3-dehydroquinate dehydratase